MVPYQLITLKSETTFLINDDMISLIYVIDGELVLWHEYTHNIIKIKSGYYTVIPSNHAIFIDCQHSLVYVLQINIYVINLVASDLGFLNHYQNDIILSTKDFQDIINKQLATLCTNTPNHDLKLNTDLSYSLISLLKVLKLHLNDSNPDSINRQSYHSAFDFNEDIQFRLFESAIELSYNHKKTIAQIALDYGFYDQSHFTKTFKKYKNMTPSAFRKWSQSQLSNS
ncbi:helix-turn-helix domain-containing protein [Mammaliicoccus stepanovicii]|uniref:DNA-binding transcriptional activator FeaR n=1 Tax=Mammaliicoccus stepanovicii TaxID=643214 RepID=A0A239YXP5_9STAP|nr:helix-turn-helix domain-containing protein [Mammaliicoccus stepanovicii]PNZ74406.1 hypothetical protein CD111_08850 [Mammaliicoccus stepanovicii]GGI40531.1 hypothetical protein GCM10010896_08840 [Mammaliicoccus stepanovicii]SNV63530.1 DNA-binding transcriptional activator FeaR [Mammaliicoccus stepanovicii]